MKIEIIAGGIYGAGGKEVEVGTVLDVKSEPKGWAGRYRVVSGGEVEAKGGKGGKGGKTAVTNPAKYEAVEKDGAWVIVDGDGATVGKPLSADDAAAFNALSDADKAEYVKAAA